MAKYGDRVRTAPLDVNNAGYGDVAPFKQLNSDGFKAVVDTNCDARMTLFALVDHSGQAEKVGMKMRSTKLLVFGSPKAGTPLMLAAPRRTIDLPLKILIWEDNQGKVWVSYNSPDYLKQRHSLPQGLLQNIAVVETLAAKAGEQLGTNTLPKGRGFLRSRMLVQSLRWFLPQRPYLRRGQPRGLTFGLFAHRSFGRVDDRTNRRKQPYIPGLNAGALRLGWVTTGSGPT